MFVAEEKRIVLRNYGKIDPLNIMIILMRENTRVGKSP